MSKPCKKSARRERLSDLIRNNKHPTRDSYFNFKMHLKQFDSDSSKKTYTKEEVLNLIVGATQVGYHERNERYQILLTENLAKNLKQSERRVVAAVVERYNRKVSHLIQPPLINVFFNAKHIELKKAEDNARYSVHNVRSILNDMTTAMYLYQRNLSQKMLQKTADEFVNQEKTHLSLRKGQFISYFRQREGRFDNFLSQLMVSLSEIKCEIRTQINYHEELEIIPTKGKLFVEKNKRELDRIQKTNDSLICRCEDLTKQFSSLSDDVILAKKDLERIDQAISENVRAHIRPTRTKLTALINRLHKQNNLFDFRDDELTSRHLLAPDRKSVV